MKVVAGGQEYNVSLDQNKEDMTQLEIDADDATKAGCMRIKGKK